MAIRLPEVHAIRELEVVELITDAPELGLRSGQRGTVVEVYNSGEAYEVEFVDTAGYTTALVTLKAHQVRQPKRSRSKNGGSAQHPG